MADLELIESLADKSLIQLTGDEPRIRMLQTIRDFGQERLAESPERQVIAQRHAEFFLALAEESEQLLAGSEQTRWLDLLEREQANLRAAIDWLRDEGQIEEALRLGGALWRFWWLRGDIDEGRHQLESLLAQTAPVSPAVRAKALNGAGVLAESQGDWDTATRLHEESLEISRQHRGSARCRLVIEQSRRRRHQPGGLRPGASLAARRISPSPSRRTTRPVSPRR